MKKLLLSTMVLVSAVITQAQSTNYKSFKVNIGLGYAIPMSGSGGTSGGAAFSIEPQYRLNNSINLGVRIEGAATARVANTNNSNASADVAILSSYTASGEYYFKPKGFRTFVGAGAGIFSLSAANVNANNTNTNLSAAASRFGFYPRVGFETGHFRVTSEYNLVGAGADYLSFKIGFFLGGGKK